MKRSIEKLELVALNAIDYSTLIRGYISSYIHTDARQSKCHQTSQRRT